MNYICVCVFVQTYIPMGKFCRTSFHRGLTLVDDDDDEDEEVDIPSENPAVVTDSIVS